MGRARRTKTEAAPVRFVPDQGAQIAGIYMGSSDGEILVYSPLSGAMYVASMELEDFYDHGADEYIDIDDTSQIEEYVSEKITQMLQKGGELEDKVEVHISYYDIGNEETEVSGTVFLSELTDPESDLQKIIDSMRRLGRDANDELLHQLLLQKEDLSPEERIDLLAYELGFSLVGMPPTYREVLLEEDEPLRGAGMRALARERKWDMEHDIRFLEAEARRSGDPGHLQKARARITRLYKNNLRMEVESSKLAPLMHEEWRRAREAGPQWQVTEDPAWIEKHGTSRVDIASLSFEELPRDWQEENREAVRVALRAMENAARHYMPSFKKVDAVAETIYRERCKRMNLGTKPSAWRDLPEEEKNKDRLQVRIILSRSDRFYLDSEDQISYVS